MNYLSLSFLNILVITLLAIIMIWKIRKERKAGFPRDDERTAKIGGKAAIGAFWINYGFMISVLIIWNIIGTEFFDLPEPDAGWTIIAIMLVSSLSYALLRWYYGRTGEL